MRKLGFVLLLLVGCSIEVKPPLVVHKIEVNNHVVKYYIHGSCLGSENPDAIIIDSYPPKFNAGDTIKFIKETK